MNPKESCKTISADETGPRAGDPTLRPDATIEEFDEWLLALGGRELTPEESAKLRAEIRWHNLPGESV